MMLYGEDWFPLVKLSLGSTLIPSDPSVNLNSFASPFNLKGMGMVSEIFRLLDLNMKISFNQFRPISTQSTSFNLTDFDWLLT